MVGPTDDQQSKGHRSYHGGRRGGGNRGGHYNRRGNSVSGGRKERVIDEEAEKKNPFLAQFRNHAASLDKRHDKRERLVKLSRDITIESKRIIFLLHRIKHIPKVYSNF